MVSNTTKKRFGLLPPAYHFALNAYLDMRFTSCPQCRAKTGQRKRPLLIHIDPHTLIALNYTNRYCNRCDLLIAHKHEIEHFLTEMFRRVKPEILGNDYLIIGVVERETWAENMREAMPIEAMRAHISDFKSYEELRMTMGGWFPAGQEPPVSEPAASTEWVKR
jgi:hypothetical protein